MRYAAPRLRSPFAQRPRFVAGLERVAEELMGRRKWRQLGSIGTWDDHDSFATAWPADGPADPADPTAGANGKGRGTDSPQDFEPRQDLQCCLCDDPLDTSTVRRVSSFLFFSFLWPHAINNNYYSPSWACRGPDPVALGCTGLHACIALVTALPFLTWRSCYSRRGGTGGTRPAPAEPRSASPPRPAR